MSILASVKKTIAYAKKYGGNLTEEQLFERLIDDKAYTKEEINKFIELLSYKVIKSGKNKILEEKIKKAKELAKLIDKQFKDILFLGITGSVAADYPKKDDDIDIIIITKVNKLWITRLKLRFFIIINKIPHRKFEKKEKRDEFCFNLWLDEKSLEIKNEKQNLRNAMDLILVKTLINKEGTYEKFIKTNNWAKKYVATGYNNKLLDCQIVRLSDKTKNNLVDEMVNWLVFWPQFWYMKKRIKNEKISLHQAFFHH
ncbi:MAG: hypothetical protein PHE32_00105 [Candidatus Shapirobacteria bacterium]|nr:hypothetical protein [Candidatus Shapirobacteria bacterium]MDD4410103.1 hypothetical protein [Candidatus Shapirobacteria bacterium]